MKYIEHNTSGNLNYWIVVTSWEAFPTENGRPVSQEWPWKANPKERSIHVLIGDSSLPKTIANVVSHLCQLSWPTLTTTALRARVSEWNQIHITHSKHLKWQICWIIFNPYLFRRELFWGCSMVCISMINAVTPVVLFWVSQVICTTRHWPTATSGIVKRVGFHAKITLTPPSAAKIYVLTPNSLQIGCLKSSWVQCLKSQEKWFTIEILPLWNILWYIKALIFWTEFVPAMTQTNNINKPNELVSAPAKIFNGPESCYVWRNFPTRAIVKSVFSRKSHPGDHVHSWWMSWNIS